MVEFLELILSPFTWALDALLTLYVYLTGIPGLSVVLVSLTVSTLALPALKYGRRIEDRTQEKMERVNALVTPLRVEFSGEELFLRTDEIYQSEGYHPIENIKLGMSFIVLLPVFIAALFVFPDHPLLVGESFGLIKDLTAPDQILGGINIIPICMSGLTMLDAFFRYRDNPGSFIRFAIIAIVLFILVYGLDAALVMYWTVNNLFTFILHMFKSSGAQN